MTVNHKDGVQFPALSLKVIKMYEYEKEIIEDNKELLYKYLFNTTEEGFWAVQYWIGRDYTFGYDYIHVYFRSKFTALCFISKHKAQCGENPSPVV